MATRPQRFSRALVLVSTIVFAAPMIDAQVAAATSVEDQQREVERIVDELDHLHEQADILAEEYAVAVDDKNQLDIEIAKAEERVAAKQAELVDVAGRPRRGCGAHVHGCRRRRSRTAVLRRLHLQRRSPTRSVQPSRAQRRDGHHRRSRRADRRPRRGAEGPRGQARASAAADRGDRRQAAAGRATHRAVHRRAGGGRGATRRADRRGGGAPRRRGVGRVPTSGAAGNRWRLRQRRWRRWRRRYRHWDRE